MGAQGPKVVGGVRVKGMCRCGAIRLTVRLTELLRHEQLPANDPPNITEGGLAIPTEDRLRASTPFPTQRLVRSNSSSLSPTAAGKGTISCQSGTK